MPEGFAKPIERCVYDEKVDMAASVISDAITDALLDRPSRALLCLLFSTLFATANLF